MKRLFTIVLFLVATAPTSAFTAEEMPRHFCVTGAVDYELFVTSINGSILVTGTRFSSTDMPVSGSGRVGPNGLFQVGLSERFDWATGSWLHPHGTTILEFPGGDLSAGTYDTTYHGDGNAPNASSGSTSLMDCELMGRVAVGDPNAR